jgi:NAD(P)-dependent dehydrogenase (short-subunit alcohol dehydrogenase family)
LWQALSLEDIGDRWAQGELSVADEHRASAVATRVVSRLGARFLPRGPKRGTVVVAAPEGELHGVPVSMAADVLRWHGFAVVDLGADTPADAARVGADHYTGRAAGQLLRTVEQLAGSTLSPYARAKRAQVVLASAWADQLGPDGVASFAMNPGWVDTPELRAGLPRFQAILRLSSVPPPRAPTPSSGWPPVGRSVKPGPWASPRLRPAFTTVPP